jgi:replicative DNA helicase
MEEMDKVIESEREVLGNIINNNSLMLKTIGKLKDDDFYSGVHQILFKTMKELYKNDNTFDSIILINKLRNEIKDKLISVTEITNISMDGVKSTFNSHLNAVIESSRQRKLIKLMQTIEKSTKNSQDKINYIQDELMKMNIDSDDDKVYSISKLLEISMNKVQQAYNSKNGIIGVPTGFEELDNAINGLQRKNMIVFGARPSLGKTAFVLKMLENMKANVLFVQLDMSLDEIGCRMLATETMMSNGKVSRGKLADNEWSSLAIAFNKLSTKDNLMFYSPAEATISKIRAKAKEIKTKKGLDVIIIDHIGKIKPETKGSMYEQTSVISNQVKAIARELNVAMVALCQLSRAVEQRADKHPIMSDLRDSGNIEADADTIGMLYRQGYYDAREKGEKIRYDVLEASFQKCRNGRLGVLKMDYDLETQKITPKIS